MLQNRARRNDSLGLASVEHVWLEVEVGEEDEDRDEQELSEPHGPDVEIAVDHALKLYG